MATTDLLTSTTALSNFTDSTSIPESCKPLYVTGISHILVTHVSLSLAILGIPANILALIVLNYRVTNRSPTHILLTALAIEDILIIIFYSIYYIAIHYFESDHIEWIGKLRHIDSPLFYLVNSSKMIEIYTIVFLSLERYVAIRWPLKASRLCSVGRTKRGLRIIVILSAIFKLPNLILDFQVLKWNEKCQTESLEPVFGSYPWHKTFKLAYVQILDQVCSFVIPLSLLVFLNFGLILRIRRFTKRHKQGNWVGSKKLSSDNSANSAMYYSEASPNTLNSIAYGDKALLTRKLTFQPSYRSKRSNGNIETELSGKEETVSRANPSIDGGGSSNAHLEARSRSMSANNQSILVTLVGVVTVFLICETPTTICFITEMTDLIYNHYQERQDGSESMDKSSFRINFNDVYQNTYPAALILVLVGCSSNFFIYMLIGRRFRRNCKQLFTAIAHKLSCCKDKTKNAPDYGFIRPKKYLRRSKVKKCHLPVPLGRPMRLDSGKVMWNASGKPEFSSTRTQHPNHVHLISNSVA